MRAKKRSRYRNSEKSDATSLAPNSIDVSHHAGICSQHINDFKPQALDQVRHLVPQVPSLCNVQRLRYDDHRNRNLSVCENLRAVGRFRLVRKNDHRRGSVNGDHSAERVSRCRKFRLRAAPAPPSRLTAAAEHVPKLRSRSPIYVVREAPLAPVHAASSFLISACP